MNSAVLFDFGGTLDADGLTWKERFHRLFEAHGHIPPAEFEEIYYRQERSGQQAETQTKQPA